MNKMKKRKLTQNPVLLFPSPLVLIYNTKARIMPTDQLKFKI